MQQVQQDIDTMVAAALAKHLPVALKNAMPDNAAEIRFLKRKVNDFLERQHKGEARGGFRKKKALHVMEEQHMLQLQPSRTLIF